MKKQHIYFFQTESGPVKIGITFNVERRFKIAQTFNHERLQIIGTFPGNSKIEKTIQGMFREHHMRGEWFRGDKEITSIAKGIYDLDYEKQGGRLYPVLWRDYINSPTDICPFCFDRHFHGVLDGHSTTHCLKRFGFSVIQSKSGDCFSIEDGYIIRSRSQSETDSTFTQHRRPIKNRIQQYKQLLMLAFEAGIEAGLFNLDGEIFINDSNRNVTWHHNGNHLCKALFSNLGYQEIGISALLGLRTPNRNPVTFPDYRDSRHCQAWISGIYNLKLGKIMFDENYNPIDLYVSKYSESVFFQ